jgi:hypothetical protein
MMVFDMTAELAPVFYGMVSLLAVCGVGIIASSLPRALAKGMLPTGFRSKARPAATNAVVHASA